LVRLFLFEPLLILKFLADEICHTFELANHVSSFLTSDNGSLAWLRYVRGLTSGVAEQLNGNFRFGASPDLVQAEGGGILSPLGVGLLHPLNAIVVNLFDRTLGAYLHDGVVPDGNLHHFAYKLATRPQVCASWQCPTSWRFLRRIIFQVNCLISGQLIYPLETSFLNFMGTYHNLKALECLFNCWRHIL
jgi:hypothetical protein